MSLLEAQNLCWGVPSAVKAGDSLIFRDINFRVEAGTWVTLSGPSGVGKTTVLSLCAGLLKPVSGWVKLFGQDIGQLSDYELGQLRARRLGLIFQNYHLDDSRTALENIMLPGYFSDLNWHGLRERALELAEKLFLTDHLSKSVSVLSGGQRQRVAVGRALLVSPELVLADEPTGALDQKTADSVLDILSDYVKEGASVLSVTHDQQVLQRGSVHLNLSEGRIEEVGKR